MGSQPTSQSVARLLFREEWIRVLGTLLGHEEYVKSHLEHVAVDHQKVLDRIPALSDLQ